MQCIRVWGWLAGRLPADTDDADDTYVFGDGRQNGWQLMLPMLAMLTCLGMVGRKAAS